MEKIIIRKATLKDLKSIWEIEKQSRQLHKKVTDKKYQILTKSDVKKKDEVNFIKDLKENLKDKKVIFLVAEFDKKVIGWTWSKFGIWRWSNKPLKMLWLEDIGVSIKYRNQGIGKKLLNATENMARGKGIKYSYLTVWLKNKPAYNFYKKNKFNDFAIEMVKELK